MTFIRRFTASAKPALLVLFSLVLLTACASDASTQTAGAPLVNITQETGEVDENEPIVGGDLYVSIPANPTTFHPMGIKDEDMFNLMSMVFEPAVKTNTDGTFSPSIVESWEVNEAGTTFTFKVRQDVTFHADRGFVSAADLEFTMDLIMDLAEQDTGMSTDDDQDSEQPFLTPYADYADVISSYTMVDSYTLRVVATHKTADVLRFMNFPVLPQTYYTGMDTESLSLPVGTGPYYMSSYSNEEGALLLPNEQWWRRLPYIESVVARESESEEAKLANFQLDLFNCVTTSSITANNYRSVSNTNVYSATTQYYDALVPNMRDNVMSDPVVREAMSLALDRREIISSGLLGEAVSTLTPLRPDMWYLEDMQYEDVENNIAMANALLEQAMWDLNDTGIRNQGGTELEVTLVFSESEEYYYREAVAGIIKEQLALIGMNVIISEQSSEEFRALMENKTFDLALASFYMKSNNDISFLFDESATANYGEYISGDLRELMDRANDALTDEEQKTAYVALETYLRENLPHIGLYYKEHSMLISADVKGVFDVGYLNAYLGISDWHFSRD